MFTTTGGYVEHSGEGGGGLHCLLHVWATLFFILTYLYYYNFASTVNVDIVLLYSHVASLRHVLYIFSKFQKLSGKIDSDICILTQPLSKNLENV